MPILPQEILPLWILFVTHDVEKVPKQSNGLGGQWRYSLDDTSIAPGASSTFRIGNNDSLRLSSLSAAASAATSFDTEAHAS